MFLVVHLPLIAPDFMASPYSELNDGCMQLMFIKEGISKATLINLFTQTENGDFLNSPYLEYVRVKAFRLEPLSMQGASNDTQLKDGIMMIDGERIPYGKVQGEIVPSLANILVNKRI